MHTLVMKFGGTSVGSVEALEETVRYARFGVMPPWGERLSEAEIKAVTAYVHQLGGGE